MCQIKPRLTHIHEFHSYRVIDLNNVQIIDLMSQFLKEKSAITGRQRSGLIIIDE